MPKQWIDTKPNSELEEALGYTFQNPALLRQALTHASAINENHPDAFNLDLAPLAFVGDSALKYGIARYLLLNGRDDVVTSCAKLHDAVQTVIPDKVLAEIARHKLYLEEYLIRGKSHLTPSPKMYADCMEAILGAIALDCGTDRQAAIFCVIEKLCSRRYGDVFKEPMSNRCLSYIREDENRWNNNNGIDWPKYELKLAMHGRQQISSRQEESCCQMLGRICLWIFAILGFLTFCFGLIYVFKLTSLEVKIPRRWGDL